MIEIERKFIVSQDSWRHSAVSATPIRQGYMCREPTVRVRRYGERAFLTIKGPAQGIAREEFEYEIPLDEAERMLETLCDPAQIEKVRYEVRYDQRLWVVDVFGGENAGLVLAEIELEDAKEQVELPDWLGEEVSEDARYFNSALAQHPVRRWR